MFSGRSHWDDQYRDERCNSRCSSSEGDQSHVDRKGIGRQGWVRLGDKPMLYRRRGPMGNNILDSLGSRFGDGLGGGIIGEFRDGLGDGMGGFGGDGPRDGFGLRGLPRDPMMGGDVYGRRNFPTLGPGMSYMDDDLASRRWGLYPNDGPGSLSQNRRERLRERAAMLEAGMGGAGMSPRMGHSPLMSPFPSPIRSPNEGDMLDMYRTDRQQMPYGRYARPAAGNYRPPYVEDYESEMNDIEARMMDQAMMERELIAPEVEGSYRYGGGRDMGGQQFMY